MISEHRQAVGRSGLTVSRLIFGGNVFGWTADEATSFYLLDACVDAGLDTIDTADVYTRLDGGEGGESETMIGRWLKARGQDMRDRITLISKCGLPMGEGRQGLSKRYIPQAFEASLKRLNTDHIDLYMAHWDDPMTPLEESLEAFEALKERKLIRAIGGSNYSPERLRDVVRISRETGLSGFEAFEVLYNLYDRSLYEDEIGPICADAGILTFSYFSLASGFLTGKYRDNGPGEGNKRAMFLKNYFTPRGSALLNVLDDIAGETRSTSAILSLAWLLSKSSLASVIASASTPVQFDTLLAALTLRPSDAVLARLDEASMIQPAGV